MNYFIFTYATNLVSCYFVWRLWVCYFINKYPGIHRNNFKEMMTTEPLPILAMCLLAPIPFVGLLTSFVNMSDGMYFKYHKPKIVLKIRDNVDVGYVPKYVHPKNQDRFLYSFDCVAPHEYTPTPRMIKARSGNFLPTER